MTTRIIPAELPRFSESFRILIDHPDHDTRLLTGEWEDSAGWARASADFCPLLAKAGRLGFIASTVPAGEHGREMHYYGMDNPPTITWHWVDGAWKCFNTRAAVERYCMFRGVTVEIFDLPRGVDVPWPVRDRVTIAAKR